MLAWFLCLRVSFKSNFVSRKRQRRKVVRETAGGEAEEEAEGGEGDRVEGMASRTMTRQTTGRTGMVSSST